MCFRYEWHIQVSASQALDSFRFYTKTRRTEDYEDEIFSILRSAHARTSVILAAKSDSRRHSTTGFSKNVVATEASYQMLDVLLFCVRERAFKPHSIKITVLNFLVKKVRQFSFPGCLFFVNTRKTKLNLVLVLESYGLN